MALCKDVSAGSLTELPSSGHVRVLRELVRAGLAESGATGLTESDWNGTDWNFVLASARRHKLSSLVYEAVRRGKLDSSLPRSTWKALYSDYYTNLALNLVLFDHLQIFVEASLRCGAPVLLLKGAAFAGWLYGNPALRPMSDLDVLVQDQDKGCMVQMAEKLGYERFDVSDHALSLRHPITRTYLEIHTSLTSCPDYLGTHTESLIDRSTSALWPKGARTISPEDHLFHLCLHGSFQHGLRQPAINACDGYLLSQRPELDWERFLERATTPRLAPLVYAGLGLCHRVLPSADTEQALQALSPHVRRRHRRWLDRLSVSQLLSPEPESTWGSPWNRILWMSSIKDSYRLIDETLRPRATEATPTPWSTLGRAVKLVYRHAVAPWNRPVVRPRVGTRTQP